MHLLTCCQSVLSWVRSFWSWSTKRDTLCWCDQLDSLHWISRIW